MHGVQLLSLCVPSMDEGSIHYMEDQFNALMTWVDTTALPEDVIKAKQETVKLFDCNSIGSMTEYVGCKIVHGQFNRVIKITKPIMFQSFQDRLPKMPAETSVQGGLLCTAFD